MPKQTTFRVVSFAPEVEDCWYPVRVVELGKDPKKKRVRVTLEHLHKSQEGNVRTTVVSLPVRPHGRTAQFFQACGCRTEVGAEIAPRDLVGRIIRVMLGNLPDGGLDVVAFKPGA